MVSGALEQVHQAGFRGIAVQEVIVLKAFLPQQTVELLLRVNVKERRPIGKQRNAESERAAVDPDGTVYLTGNSASDSKYYDMRGPSVYERYSAVALQLEEPTYMNVEVTDDSLTFTTYKVSNLSVVDAYSIVKTVGE